MATRDPSSERSALVLVVHDDADAREMLGLGLESNGFCVAQAGSAFDALAVASKTPPDVTILDIGLPDSDGCALCRRLRQGRATKRTPIIGITSDVSSDDTRRAFAAGCDEVLDKACPPSDLVEAIYRHLREFRIGGPGATPSADVA